MVWKKRRSSLPSVSVTIGVSFTPDDMRSSCSIVTRPYALPASSDTYLSARSSSEPSTPRSSAMPVSIPTSVLAIDADKNRVVGPVPNR